jgi:broad specificity phosphatase PhoE
MEIYLIRHGQSSNNALGTATGRSKDPSLTKIGFQQAATTAAYLANASLQIDRLYCSAMLRALQTVQPIGAAMGLTPEVWVDVHEGGGIYLDQPGGEPVGYSGLTRAEILDQFPGYELPADVTDEGWWNRGYERDSQAIGRAIDVAEHLIERSQDGNEHIAIVTHGFFTNLLLKVLLSQIPARDLYYYHNNTGITRLDINADGFIVMRFLNRTEHLSADLMTY